MTVDLDAFERAYRTSADPWRFATSPYETARYATTSTWIGDIRFARAFEPGCSIGVFTAQLAPRCDELVACDVSPTACAAARARTAAMGHVTIRCAAIPAWWPDGRFDLVVLAELGYYWDAAGVHELGRLTRQSAAGGTVVAVHWLGHSADHVQHGAAVHDQLEAVLGHPDARAEVDPAGDQDPSQMFAIERWTPR